MQPYWIYSYCLLSRLSIIRTFLFVLFLFVPIIEVGLFFRSLMLSCLTAAKINFSFHRNGVTQKGVRFCSMGPFFPALVQKRALWKARNIMFSLMATDIGVFTRMITGNVFFKIEIKKVLFLHCCHGVTHALFWPGASYLRVDGVTIKSIIISVQYVSIGYWLLRWPDSTI